MDLSTWLQREKIDLLDAAIKVIAVTPMNPKNEVIRKLDAAGLQSTDARFLNELNELVSLMTGGSTPSKLLRQEVSAI